MIRRPQWPHPGLNRTPDQLRLSIDLSDSPRSKTGVAKIASNSTQLAATPARSRSSLFHAHFIPPARGQRHPVSRPAFPRAGARPIAFEQRLLDKIGAGEGCRAPEGGSIASLPSAAPGARGLRNCRGCLRSRGSAILLFGHGLSRDRLGCRSEDARSFAPRLFCISA